MSARDELFEGLTDGGWNPAPGEAESANALLDTYRDDVRAEVLAEAVPAWEAAYDSATFTPYLIGYCNDLVSAQAAALAWFRSQVETADHLAWEQDPQMADSGWDQWFRLRQYDADDGAALATDIIVRHRAEAGDGR
jgi:hypothetical protein